MGNPDTNLDRLLQESPEILEHLSARGDSDSILLADFVVGPDDFRSPGRRDLSLLHTHTDLVTGTIAEFRWTAIAKGEVVIGSFSEPAFAVRAAVEVERRLLRLNYELPESDRFDARIGINSAAGAGINEDTLALAIAVTKCAGPGQILATQSVRGAVLFDPDIRCTWMGRVQERAKREDIFEIIWREPQAYLKTRSTASEEMASMRTATAGGIDHRSGTPPRPMDGAANRANKSAANLTARAEVNRYEILNEIGRGGMGIVYKARDRDSGEIVALKVLKPEIAADESMMKRFKNELRLARQITHKNVCRIYDLNRIHGTFCISMELVEGEGLRAVLNRFGALGVRKGIQIARQICAGLAEAHAQGVVHRDLKPENIMVDRAGNVKIMDFGIARSVDMGMSTVPGIVGTPAYMSPEQAQSKRVDCRADIYFGSCGCHKENWWSGSALD